MLALRIFSLLVIYQLHTPFRIFFVVECPCERFLQTLFFFFSVSKLVSQLTEISKKERKDFCLIFVFLKNPSKKRNVSRKNHFQLCHIKAFFSLMWKIFLNILLLFQIHFSLLSWVDSTNSTQGSIPSAAPLSNNRPSKISNSFRRQPVNLSPSLPNNRV